MKQKLHFIPVLLISMLSLLQISCSKEPLTNMDAVTASKNKSEAAKALVDPNSNPGTDRADGEPCEPTETALIAGQTIPAGTVTVTNDADYIYVTYSTANGYTLKETHLFVGNCDAIPVNNNGNPVPGAFPYTGTHENITYYTYQVPISTIGLGNCGCIASHAVVEKLDANGVVIDRQTAWGSGIRFVNRGNWATKFPYCPCL